MLLRLGLLLMIATPSSGASVERLVSEQASAWSGAAGDADWQVLYAPEVSDPVAVIGFWRDDRSGRFAADLALPDGEVRRVEGVALRMQDVPVPRRHLMPGEIISEGDLDLKAMPARRVPAFALTAMDALVGQQVHRMLAEGRPIAGRSVRAPLAIRKGDRVEIRFAEGGLVVAAPGKALSDAASGGAVRIVNLASNRSLNGVARPNGIVEVVR
ncbi:flagellar basal body P-ring formation protein FlgA [Jannaschia sp. Os4]|uniref:flagellar basal body P-ring formation chaperone FlgA n=1 Tax=Jannaschia sp. Os4 TaxID=2807617 RepID=UPI00193A8540|nr:flagellar basal body P-ring formation chaperone FlgA [Jannaschia sp. Os4]MBM2575686.1 flagellar basal body P-ring formation protein FlgA [Jannaschia sp. Os4]